MEQTGPTLLASVFVDVWTRTAMKQGETGVDRDGPVRAYSDGASGLQEEHSSDCTGDGSHTGNNPQSPAGFVAEVPEKSESGMCGDGFGRRDSREMVDVRSGGVQEAEAYGASDLYAIS